MPAHHLTPRIENAAEYRCRLRHVRKALAIAVLLLGVLLLAGCGESSEEKAKAQVCTAKSDISKQVKMLSELTISTSLLTQAKDGLEAIASDLTKIKDAQPNLAPARKEQISSATHTFEAQVCFDHHRPGLEPLAQQRRKAAQGFADAVREEL